MARETTAGDHSESDIGLLERRHDFWTVWISCRIQNNSKTKKIVEDYNKKIISDKLVKIIMSYIGFVNENNYKK